MPQTSDPLTFLLQERDIKQDSKEYSYREIAGYTESWPVCPVPAERGSYAESSDAPLVQEKPRPIVLLIPQDIRCDGLLCPIPPIESQLTNPELSSAILQEFLPIAPYIEPLIRDTANGTSVGGVLMGFLVPELIAYLLEFCYGRWSGRKKPEKDRDEGPAGRESEGPQSPAPTHDNMEEEAGLSSRRSQKREEPRSAKMRKKRRQSEAHEPRGSHSEKRPQKTKSNGTMTGEEEKEFKQLLQQFLCQCLQGEF
ncbi:hypothetical protein XENTR_v10013112 [Xenopus tropicalis]|uniref:Uncharacterized protein LOC116410792 n=1 Tax=Xenopus tropicalis TaxID=8364 RepID=A0A8J1JIK7_XENTR|nr:uncharacterized protein LOC116410792 [Xenopus tropicalis]KAE8600165.1 hypothetical protein XENTR_v10013112 [Xenopus tropicalis]